MDTGENKVMKHPVYLVGFCVRKKILWVATDRADLTAAEITFIYSLRRDIDMVNIQIDIEVIALLLLFSISCNFLTRNCWL